MRWLGTILLRFHGWTWEGGDHGDVPRLVVIANPHTSNWDFYFMMLGVWSRGLQIRWMGKHTLFEPPFGWFFRLLGGLPIVRHSAEDVVEAQASALRGAERLWIVVPAAGTRSKQPYWKSGFYRIALAAGVPIAPSFLDYGRRRMGLGVLVEPTGDVGADMDRIRAGYEGVQGKYPDRQTPVRLRSEDEPQGAA